MRRQVGEICEKERGSLGWSVLCKRLEEITREPADVLAMHRASVFLGDHECSGRAVDADPCNVRSLLRWRPAKGREKDPACPCAHVDDT